MFIIVLVSIFWVGYAMRAITVPLLIALALAYLVEPVIDVVGRKWGWSRRWTVSGILMLFIIGVVLVVVPTTMLVVGQTAELVGNVRSGKYAGLVDKGVALLPADYQDQVGSLREWLEESAPWTRVILGEHTPVVDAADATPPPSGGEAKATETKVATAAAGDAATPVPAVNALDEEQIRQIVRDEMNAAPSGITDGTDAKGLGISAIGFVGKGMQQVTAVIFSTVELGLLVFLVPFYFYFFSNAYPRVLKFGRSLVPDHNRVRTFFLIGEMDRAVSGFVRGRLVISAILGVVLSVGWLIVGVPYSIALGLVVGVFCAVPYLSVIGLPVAIGLLTFEEFSLQPEERMAWWGVVVWPLLVYMIAQSLDDWVLTPLIQGKATDLDPVSVVVAILAGGSIAGIYGMLLAVPVAACIKIVIREVLMPRVHAWTSGEARDPLPGGD